MFIGNGWSRFSLHMDRASKTVEYAEMYNALVFQHNISNLLKYKPYLSFHSAVKRMFLCMKSNRKAPKLKHYLQRHSAFSTPAVFL